MEDAFAHLDYDVMMLGKMLDNSTGTRAIDAMVDRIIADLRDIAPQRIRAYETDYRSDSMDEKDATQEVRA